MSGLGTLLRSLAVILPLKVVIGLSVLTAVLLAPAWFESIRDRQLRGLVRRMVRADAVQRAQLTTEALTLAMGKERRLVTLVEQASKYDQPPVRARALEALEGLGVSTARFKPAAKAPQVRDPIEAAVRIERMLRNGLLVTAREALGPALAAFPTDEELVDLDTRLTERERAAAAEAASRAAASQAAQESPEDGSMSPASGSAASGSVASGSDAPPDDQPR
ncbi:MAG: hypothetical protein ABMB14_00870 [Myxococcota bacterium]